jgi:hypothetical protein
MSIRVIASVGVMLSIAVTSFSIYLGIVEHSYSPVHTGGFSIASLEGRKSICVQYHVAASTTSTVVPGSEKVVPCADTST